MGPFAFDPMDTGPAVRVHALMPTRHDVLDVSVLTPSYEYGRLIADGIESVIQQQGLRLQHITQDAGSGDDIGSLASFGD
jgi:hypothetical protein